MPTYTSMSLRGLFQLERTMNPHCIVDETHLVAYCCRHDFIQTGEYVTITIFAKVINPERSLITVTPTTVRAYLGE